MYLTGLGSLDMGQSCAGAGRQVCYGPNEEAAAAAAGCRMVSGAEPCDPGGSGAGEMSFGTVFCCPSATAGAGVTTAKTGVAALVSDIASAAQQVAQKVVPGAVEDMLPTEELPEHVATGIERYSTHITIASTVIGVGLFVWWLKSRKGAKK